MSHLESVLRSPDSPSSAEISTSRNSSSGMKDMYVLEDLCKRASMIQTSQVLKDCESSVVSAWGQRANLASQYYAIACEDQKKMMEAVSSSLPMVDPLFKKVLVKPDEAACLELGPLAVHVMPGCVSSPTEISAKLLPNDDGLAWTMPFELKFLDGSQPQSPVEIFVKTVDVNVECSRVQLCYLSDGSLESEVAIGNAFCRFDPSGKCPPQEVCATTDHFSMFRFRIGPAIATFDGLRVEENRAYNRGYDNIDESRRPWTRGGETYLLPHAFQRKALRVEDFDDNTVAAFHGTQVDAAQSIINDRFQLPSERGGVRPGHIPLAAQRYGVPNWADGVFLSPSHKYCMAPTYGCNGTLREMRARPGQIFVCTGTIRDDRVVFCLLQCRVARAGLTEDPRHGGKVRFPGTTGRYNACDRRVTEDEMEYRVHDPRAITPYGLLFRFVPRHDVEPTISNADNL